MKNTLKALCLLLAFAATEAFATPLQFNFSIKVEYILTPDGLPATTHFPLGGEIAVGDTLTGTIAFDPDKYHLPPDMQGPTWRHFQDADGRAQRLRLTTAQGVSYQSAAAPHAGSVQLTHGDSDLIAFNTFDDPLTIGLLLANWDGNVFDSLDLPARLNLADFPYSWFGMGWGVGTDQQVDVRGVVTAIAMVPEPSSWALLIAGALGVAAVRRRSIA